MAPTQVKKSRSKDSQPRPIFHSHSPQKHKHMLQGKQGVCGLAIYIKKYLKAKKRNYGNSNISPCKNNIFKKIL